MEDITKSGVGSVLSYGVVVRFLGAPQNCGGSVEEVVALCSVDQCRQVAVELLCRRAQQFAAVLANVVVSLKVLTK